MIQSVLTIPVEELIELLNAQYSIDLDPEMGIDLQIIDDEVDIYSYVVDESVDE